MADELGLDGALRLHGGWAPIEELVAAIARADAGVVALRRDVFRDLTHANKMFDLIAMRTPAIVSRTRAVEAYFDDGCFAYFDSGDERGLADAIVALHDDPRLRQRLVRRASAVADAYRWEVQREVYRRVITC
jgi:glycosyltransferase involved in cell wall biosynthesis